VEAGTLSVDWNGYEPYVPGTAEPPHALQRAEARRMYKECMESKPMRLQMLGRLLKSNGVEQTTDDPAVQNLNNWFIANVEADSDMPGRLIPIWYSVCHDVALFLGDLMIERQPNLRWEFYTWGKTNVAFQRHVIMGFSTEDPKLHTNLDIDRMVVAYAHQIIEAQGSFPTFGTVEVRGTPIDVDAVAASHRSREIDTEAFRHWLQRAAERA